MMFSEVCHKKVEISKSRFWCLFYVELPARPGHPDSWEKCGLVLSLITLYPPEDKYIFKCFDATTVDKFITSLLQQLCTAKHSMASLCINLIDLKTCNWVSEVWMHTCAVLEPSHNDHALVPNAYKIFFKFLKGFVGNFWLFIVSSSELGVKEQCYEGWGAVSWKVVLEVRTKHKE